jgi:hypothetical protein
MLQCNDNFQHCASAPCNTNATWARDKNGRPRDPRELLERHRFQGYTGTIAAIDDSALRTAAQLLLAAARRSMPGVDWAAQVVESDHGFPGRRGTTKIDGELPTCAQKARPKPQIARCAPPHGLVWAVGGLPHKADRLLSRSRHLENIGPIDPDQAAR